MPFAPFPVLAPEAEVVALAFNKVGNDPSGSVSVVQRHKGKSNFQIDVFDAKFRRRTRSKELQMSSKPTVFGDGRGNLLLCDGTKNLFAVQDSDGTWIVRPTRIPKNVRCLAACGDSQYRLVGTTEGTLHLVDLNTSEPSADQGRKVHDRAITSASGDRVQDGKRKKGDLMELDYTVGCEDGTLVVSHLQATGCATALRVNTGKSPLVAVGPQKSNKNAHEVVAIDKEGVIHQILIATNKSRSMPQ